MRHARFWLAVAGVGALVVRVPPLTAQSVTPFASIDLEKLKIKMVDVPLRDKLTLKGTFAIDADSDDLDPTTELVRLEVGSFRFEQPGGFVATPSKFTLKIEDQRGKATIVLKRGKLPLTYQVKATISKTDLPDTDGVVRLLVGNDGGNPIVTASCEAADLDDDGKVRSNDATVLRNATAGAVPSFGRLVGEPGYLEGLDLDMDGDVDDGDVGMVTLAKGRTCPVTATSVEGVVLDGDGAPLANAIVRLLCAGGSEGVPGMPCLDGQGFPLESVTAGDGMYRIANATTGVRRLEIDGRGAGPFPSLSEPLFVNGGLVNTFRTVSLPRLDFTGARMLDPSNSVVNPDGSVTTTAPVMVDNPAATMPVPVGVTFMLPPGADPMLSITRVDPANLPVPMPPGLSSSIFITTQPGGTRVIPPDGTCNPGVDGLDLMFPNVDGISPTATEARCITNPPPAESQARALGCPFFNQVRGSGAFEYVSACFIEDTDGDGADPDVDDRVVCPKTLCDFAWGHPDVVVLTPCPPTTVVGRVVFPGPGGGFVGLGGATVSVAGLLGLTAFDGSFSVAGVPAGPNGPFCQSSAFSIRARASGLLPGGLLQVGSSGFVTAVPGGTTTVGDIVLGVPGTVQGQVLKLFSVVPTVFDALPGASITLQPEAGSALGAFTDAAGAYNLVNVPLGNYVVSASFVGEVPRFPGVVKTFFDSAFGSIDFQGDLDVVNFRFFSRGTVNVAVTDSLGAAVVGRSVRIDARGGVFGGTVIPPAQLDAVTDGDGRASFGTDTVPQGPCDISVFDSTAGAFVADSAPCFVNTHGEVVNVSVTLPTCGDGVVEGIEACDPGDPGLGIPPADASCPAMCSSVCRCPGNLTGAWLMQSPDTCSLTFVQTGSTVAGTGSCSLVGAITLAGTFDTLTQGLALTGSTESFCSGLVASATLLPDGDTITGTIDCLPSFLGLPLTITRVGGTTTTVTVTSTTSTTSSTLPGCFVDQGLTVLDTCTNLEWEKKDTAVGTGEDPANLHDVDNMYTWAGQCTLDQSVLCQPNAAAATTCAAETGGAFGCAECGPGEGTCSVELFTTGIVTTIWDWVNQLNATAFAGRTDWRLSTSAGCCGAPTGAAAELESLVDLMQPQCGDASNADACIAPMFGPTIANVYWTSSPETANVAWMVRFGPRSVLESLGRSAQDSIKWGPGWVRAVRDAP